MKMNLKTIATYLIGGLLLVSCGGQGDDQNKIDKDLLDPANSLNTDFNGKIFSIPSPIQMALLLKETSAPYNQDLLSDTKNVGK